GFSPPVASRIYAYPYIAAYEAFALTSADYQSILPDLNGVNFSFDDMEIDHEKYISEVASSFAFFHVAKPLIYRPYIIDTVEQHLLQRYKKSTLKQTDIEYSISIAQQIGDRIIAYSKSDNYKQTRNMPQYQPTGTFGSWEPTPPTYGAALEPYWHTIRPLILTSVNDFETNYEINFDTTKGSPFYEEALKVY